MRVGPPTNSTVHADSGIEVIKGMADSAPVFPPHAKPMYSNAGFNLLGFVVKKVTGMEYTRAVRRYITGPLGLEHTTFLPADHVVIPSTGLWHADLGQNNPYVPFPPPPPKKRYNPVNLNFQCRRRILHRPRPRRSGAVDPFPHRSQPEMAKTTHLRTVLNPSHRVSVGNHAHDDAHQ